MTKQGAHGVLYRYVVEYTDKSDPGFGVDRWHCWAYNIEHAIDKFDTDDGFSPLRIARAGEPSHRLNWHEV